MRNVLATAALAAIVAAGPALADEPIQLKFAIPTPPQSPTSMGLQQWAEETAKASDGALQIQTFLGPTVATIFNAYDRVLNDVIDMGFGNFGPLATQFPKSAVVTLPFESRAGSESTLGFWRIFANGTIADEYSKVHPIALLTFPGVNLHGKKQVHNLADMKGLKVAAQGRVVTRAVENLGATPVATAVAEFYTALQRGTIDYVATAWTALPTFKLHEETSYHLEVPLGTDNVYVVMNKGSFERLPQKVKTLIDSTAGVPLQERMIKVIDGATNGARTMVGGLPGHTIAQLPPDEEARWKAKVAPVIEEWTRDTPDGARVLAAFRTEVTKIRAGQ
jgi:TRAP-type C4-dicarboxylate transport system substrate-binding protein